MNPTQIIRMPPPNLDSGLEWTTVKVLITACSAGANTQTQIIGGCLKKGCWCILAQLALQTNQTLAKNRFQTWVKVLFPGWKVQQWKNKMPLADEARYAARLLQKRVLAHNWPSIKGWADLKNRRRPRVEIQPRTTLQLSLDLTKLLNSKYTVTYLN